MHRYVNDGMYFFRMIYIHLYSTCIEVEFKHMYKEIKLVKRISTRKSMHSYFIFLAFDFCRFCVASRFFHPRHNGQ